MEYIYYPPEGLKTTCINREGRIEVDSLYFNSDNNYNKPLSEVSKKI